MSLENKLQEAVDALLLIERDRRAYENFSNWVSLATEYGATEIHVMSDGLIDAVWDIKNKKGKTNIGLERDSGYSKMKNFFAKEISDQPVQVYAFGKGKYLLQYDWNDEY